MIDIPDSVKHIDGIDSTLMVRRLTEQYEKGYCICPGMNCDGEFTRKWWDTAEDPISVPCSKLQGAMEQYMTVATKITPLLESFNKFCKEEKGPGVYWRDVRKKAIEEREQEMEKLYSSREPEWLNANRHWFPPTTTTLVSPTSTTLVSPTTATKLSLRYDEKRRKKRSSWAEQSKSQGADKSTDLADDQWMTGDGFRELDSTGQPIWDSRFARAYELNFLNKGSDSDD